ncbi:DMT family transporter [Cognatishimia activa]|uniref:DMT family transporter n=1 Tax=Cognatishimia activa TaxID=1715691 RepID=UPI002230CE3F|nr:DMT family transporter [Cognatishimia activa]UZD91150.1 DMT family transporter [Cognatishimia activa]
MAVTDNTRGAMFMIALMAAFSSGDVLTKIILVDVPLPQYQALRGVLCSALIALLAWQQRALVLNVSKRDGKLMLIRSVAEVIAAYLFLTSLTLLPLANATAILQVLPLSLALSAALFFKEPLGWRRLTAILIGFCGMLLIVRPGPEGFSSGSLYALATVFFVTIRDLAARRMSKYVPSLTAALAMSLAVTLYGFVAMTQTGWQPMTFEIQTMIAAAAFLLGLGYVFSVLAMRIGDVSFVAPFRYTGLIFALIFGLVFFDEWPDFLTLIGAAIVVGTGIFTLYREAKVKSRKLEA